MKVLFLNTSEEENGLLSKGIALCCAKPAEAEIEYDVRWVKDVHPCTSCGKCLKRRRCLFDGIINELHEHSEEFDALMEQARNGEQENTETENTRTDEV